MRVSTSAGIDAYLCRHTDEGRHISGLIQARRQAQARAVGGGVSRRRPAPPKASGRQARGPESLKEVEGRRESHTDTERHLAWLEERRGGSK